MAGRRLKRCVLRHKATGLYLQHGAKIRPQDDPDLTEDVQAARVFTNKSCALNALTDEAKDAFIVVPVGIVVLAHERV